MEKSNRIAGKFVAGIIALTGAAELLSMHHDSQKQDQQNLVDDGINEKETESFGLEVDPIFCAEHPVEAELRKQISHLPKEKRDEQLQHLSHSLDVANRLIRDKRYPDKIQEKKYFGACYDLVKWSAMEKSLELASNKTGIPINALKAIGFLESQMHTNASREDTNVDGAFQMTLETAKRAAIHAKAVFGSEITIETKDDLKDFETSAKLAALELKTLKDRYGQLDLAMVAYSSSETALKEKIKAAFPEIDFGEKEWKEMKQHYEAETVANATYKKFVHLEKLKNVKSEHHDAMIQAMKIVTTEGEAYKKSFAKWKKIQTELPATLEKAGVNVLSLFDAAEKTGDVPHSLTYALAVDDVAKNATIHIALARAQKMITEKRIANE